MDFSALQQRRAFLKAGTGTLGAVGLAGLGLSPFVSRTAGAASPLDGLRPLYSKANAESPQALESPAAVSATPDASVRALRRLGFGYLPQDRIAFEALGPDFDTRLENWVDDQLNGYQPSYPPVNDPPLSAILNQPGTNFETLGDSLATLWQERVVAEPAWPYRYYPEIETQYLALVRAVYSKWQLAEVLADFWHTHFSVDGNKFEVAPVFVHYDRDVIRPHMLGNFRQMLEAVTKSTAMMYYLDNVWNSKWGPNENFAREAQELHTLGAVHSYGFTPEGNIPNATPIAGSSTVLPAGLKAGYSELDVKQFTLCLTGWTISNTSTNGLNTGQFLYYGSWHDTSPKKVLGINITASGQGEASQVMDLLAMHPNTARYVCSKLCRRLIGDNPPPSIVEAAAVVFNDQWQAPDQLKQVVRTIILSNEFKDAANWGGKTKKPFELMAGAARSCGGFTEKIVRPDPFGNWNANVLLGKHYKFSQDLYWMMSSTGNLPYTWVTPDGFPDSKAAWLGSTPLIMGWRSVNTLFMNSYPDNPANTSSSWSNFYPVDVVAVTKAQFAVNQRTARNIVNYWVKQFLGYDSSNPGSPQLDANVLNALQTFMRQDAASVDTVLDLDAGSWNNSAWLAYVPHRLQTLVASIAMLPDNMLR